MSWKAGYHLSWVRSGQYLVRVFSAVTGTAATTSSWGQMLLVYKSDTHTGSLSVQSHQRGWEWPTPPNPLLGSARTLKELISKIFAEFKAGL